MFSLNQREKNLLKILIAVIVIALAYYLIVLPLISLAGNAEDELKSNVDSLDRLERIYEEYRVIQEKKSKYLTQLKKKNENITSLVEQLATSTGIARNIAYTRRSQTPIQNKYIRITTNIRLEGIPIQSFMKFLYEIENSRNLLKTSYIRIRTGLKGTSLYDVDLKIDSFTTK